MSKAAYVVVPEVSTLEQAEALGLVHVETVYAGAAGTARFGYYIKDDAPGVKPTAAAIRKVLAGEALDNASDEQ